MHRRTLLSAVATLPILSIPFVAHAQEGVILRVTASPERAQATVTQQRGDRFLLEVTDLGFNIGMPPSSRFNIGMPPMDRLRDYDGGNLNGQEIGVSLGASSGWIRIESLRNGQWSWGESRGEMAIEANERAAGLGFLMPIASAAAAAGARALGRGGEGAVTIGGRPLGFLLENLG